MQHVIDKYYSVVEIVDGFNHDISQVIKTYHRIITVMSSEKDALFRVSRGTSLKLKLKLEMK